MSGSCPADSQSEQQWHHPLVCVSRFVNACAHGPSRVGVCTRHPVELYVTNGARPRCIPRRDGTSHQTRGIRRWGERASFEGNSSSEDTFRARTCKARPGKKHNMQYSNKRFGPISIILVIELLNYVSLSIIFVLARLSRRGEDWVVGEYSRRQPKREKN